MADPPGTPLADQVIDIGRRLKEIEAERAKERQAATLPDIVELEPRDVSNKCWYEKIFAA